MPWDVKLRHPGIELFIVAWFLTFLWPWILITNLDPITNICHGPFYFLIQGLLSLNFFIKQLDNCLFIDVQSLNLVSFTNILVSTRASARTHTHWCTLIYTCIQLTSYKTKFQDPEFVKFLRSYKKEEVSRMEEMVSSFSSIRWPIQWSKYQWKVCCILLILRYICICLRGKLENVHSHPVIATYIRG